MGGLYDDAARTGYIALHHVGASNTQFDSPGPYAAPYSGCATNGNRYDFAVNGNGAIAVGGRYRNPAGCHATTCNCEATGICMLGCFGGCGTPADDTTLAQGCGVAYVWRHLPISIQSAKMRPHRWCDRANPCDGTTLGTVCCGTMFTSGTSDDAWNATGRNFRDSLMSLARNYRDCGTCSPC